LSAGPLIRDAQPSDVELIFSLIVELADPGARLLRGAWR
jgi:hypothetical protein